MISILCPTRKRPAQLRRMIESVAATSKNKNEVICYIDDDDDARISFSDNFGIRVQFNVGPRLVYSDYWNVLLLSAQGDIFMMCGDDCVFRTPGWDHIVEQAFAESADKILLAYGDDTGPNGKTFASHPFVHRRWVEVVGYFSGPGFSGDFADSWVQDVADMIDRKKFLPIVTEHMHYYFQKAPDDETYRETRARIVRDNMTERFAARLSERQADAEKLRAVLGTPWIRTTGSWADRHGGSWNGKA